MNLLKRLVWLVVAFVIGFAVVETLAPEGKAADRTAAARTVRPKDGTELIAVFLISTNCSASSLPGLKGALAHIRVALTQTAADKKATFVTIGVALDADPWAGVEFIKTFGDFDEVISGGSWMNTAALSYVSRELPGQWAVPQLVILERDVKVTASEQLPTVSTDRLVARKVGVDEISTFANQLRTAATN